MDEKRSEFLTTMIGILKRLHETSKKHGEPLLAEVLEVARTEAEDSLRHAGHVAALSQRRSAQSAVTSWRSCDRSPDEARAVEAAQPDAAETPGAPETPEADGPAPQADPIAA